MINLLGMKCFNLSEERQFSYVSEKYFTMNKKQCREALDMYKKFIDRTDKVSQYFKVAEVG